jgi:hypothetical protein
MTSAAFMVSVTAEKLEKTKIFPVLPVAESKKSFENFKILFLFIYLPFFVESQENYMICLNMYLEVGTASRYKVPS